MLHPKMIAPLATPYQKMLAPQKHYPLLLDM
jgi:hypothetical protein